MEDQFTQEDLQARFEDFVQVPVPRSRVLEVMAYLTRDQPHLMAASASEGSVGSPDEDPSKWDDWNDEALLAMVSDHGIPPKQVLLLEHLADNAGQPVTTTAMADYLGISGRALGGVTGALKKRASWEQRQHDGSPLPFENDWSEELGSYYQMPVEYAEPVKAGIAELRAQKPETYGPAQT